MTTRRPSPRAVLLALAAVSLLLAVVLSPYASSSPDGLTYASRLLGFDSTETAHATADSPLAGYAVRGVENSALATGLSGLIGVLVVGAVALGLFALLRRSTPRGD